MLVAAGVVAVFDTVAFALARSNAGTVIEPTWYPPVPPPRGSTTVGGRPLVQREEQR
jgi:hypothetical protein